MQKFNYYSKHLVNVEPIKYLNMFMAMCLILSFEKETIYVTNSILIFYINTFQRQLFTKF